MIIELFSLAVTTEALLSEICRNWRFLKGWVTECQFQVDWDVVCNPSVDR